MTDRTRNILVGLTVMVALAGLALMIILFQDVPAALQPGYRHDVQFSNAGGVTEGTDVLLAGKRIGRVIDVAVTDDDARKGVTMTMLIQTGVNVPGDVNAYIRARSLTGGSYIDLVPDGKAPGSEMTDPDTGEPMVWLPKDRRVVLAGTSGGGGLIPDDVREEIQASLTSFRRLADSLGNYLGPPTTTQPATTPATQPTLGDTLVKLNRALDAISDTLDEKARTDLKQAIAGLRGAADNTAKAMDEARTLFSEARSVVALTKATLTNVSAATTRASDRFGELTGKLMDGADKLGEVLTSVEQSVHKLESGDGTAGKLLNDPTLYENLVDASGRLNKTLESLQDLLEQWKAKGVGIKLK